MTEPKFWIFNRSDGVEVPKTAPAEPQMPSAEVTSEKSLPEASAGKQTTITDFFSSQSSTPQMNVSVPSGGQSGTVEENHAHTFITPCPSVRLEEVPVVFRAQPDGILEHCFDPTHPIFDGYVSPAEVRRKIGKDADPCRLAKALLTPTSNR